ncbi:MAG: purine-nucleoside/S-methyl-5-thioadenosine phosphorylase / adenosine deaminase [Aliidongia sp.]|nr:purine-nucleoside/S-methyl-5-thioadenosine phosphorylase / adenosine deaminase [Aliidongia sp.]
MITHPVLDGISHGFFTRQGGTSTGIYASLNCGFGSDDESRSVAANRALLLERLGVPDLPLVTVHQIHSATVVTVEQPWARGDNPQADAMVTNRPGFCLGILTADCVPLLFADPAAGVIGAAHAGWKGALGGIAEATIAAMCRLGAEPGRIRVAIGPAIQQASYEVGAEFPARFAEADPANLRFFHGPAPDRRYRFDLPGFVESRLAALGLAQIGNTALDTCAEEARFFSYRRATLRREPDYGRQISVVALPGAV